MLLPLVLRPLDRPAVIRLSLDTPRRDEILGLHAVALASGQAGYADPATGLFVLTAGWLAARGSCCDNGCRHCPYVGDGAGQ